MLKCVKNVYKHKNIGNIGKIVNTNLIILEK